MATSDAPQRRGKWTLVDDDGNIQGSDSDVASGSSSDCVAVEEDAVHYRSRRANSKGSRDGSSMGSSPPRNSSAEIPSSSWLGSFWTTSTSSPMKSGPVPSVSGGEESLPLANQQDGDNVDTDSMESIEVLPMPCDDDGREEVNDLVEDAGSSGHQALDLLSPEWPQSGMAVKALCSSDALTPPQSLSSTSSRIEDITSSSGSSQLGFLMVDREEQEEGAVEGIKAPAQANFPQDGAAEDEDRSEQAVGTAGPLPVMPRGELPMSSVSVDNIPRGVEAGGSPRRAQSTGSIPKESQDSGVAAPIMTQRWPTEDGGFLLVQQFRGDGEPAASMSRSSSFSDLSSSFSLSGVRRRIPEATPPTLQHQSSDASSEVSHYSDTSTEELPANMTMSRVTPGIRQYLHQRDESLNSKLTLAALLIITAAVALVVGHYIGSTQATSHHLGIEAGQVWRLRSLQDQLVTCLDKTKTLLKIGRGSDGKPPSKPTGTMDTKQDLHVDPVKEPLLLGAHDLSPDDLNAITTCSMCIDPDQPEARYTEFCNTKCRDNDASEIRHDLGLGSEVYKDGDQQEGLALVATILAEIASGSINDQQHDLIIHDSFPCKVTEESLDNLLTKNDILLPGEGVVAVDRVQEPHSSLSYQLSKGSEMQEDVLSISDNLATEIEMGNEMLFRYDSQLVDKASIEEEYVESAVRKASLPATEGEPVLPVLEEQSSVAAEDENEGEVRKCYPDTDQELDLERCDAETNRMDQVDERPGAQETPADVGDEDDESSTTEYQDTTASKEQEAKASKEQETGKRRKRTGESDSDGSFMEQLSSKITDSWFIFRNFTTDLVGSAANLSVNNVTTQLKENVESLRHQIKDAVDNLQKSNITAQVKDNVQNLGSHLKDAVSHLEGGNISSTMKGMVEDVKEQISEAVSGLQESNITSHIKDGLQNLGDTIQGAMSDLKEKGKQMKKPIKQTMKAVNEFLRGKPRKGQKKAPQRPDQDDDVVTARSEKGKKEGDRNESGRDKKKHKEKESDSASAGFTKPEKSENRKKEASESINPGFSADKEKKDHHKEKSKIRKGNGKTAKDKQDHQESNKEKKISEKQHKINKHQKIRSHNQKEESIGKKQDKEDKETSEWFVKTEQRDGHVKVHRNQQNKPKDKHSRSKNEDGERKKSVKNVDEEDRPVKSKENEERSKDVKQNKESKDHFNKRQQKKANKKEFENHQKDGQPEKGKQTVNHLRNHKRDTHHHGNKHHKKEGEKHHSKNHDEDLHHSKGYDHMEHENKDQQQSEADEDKDRFQNLNLDDLFGNLNIGCHGVQDCLRKQREAAVKLYQELLQYQEWLTKRCYKKHLKELEDFMEELEEFLAEPFVDDNDLEELMEDFEDMAEDLEEATTKYFTKFMKGLNKRMGDAFDHSSSDTERNQHSSKDKQEKQHADTLTVTLDLMQIFNLSTHSLNDDSEKGSTQDTPEGREKRKHAGYGFQSNDDWFIRRMHDRETQRREYRHHDASAEVDGNDSKNDWYKLWMKGREEGRIGATVWDLYRWFSKRQALRHEWRLNEMDDQSNWFLKRP